MDRQATAIGEGDLRTGTGTLGTQSSALHNSPYSFRDRFENGPNTNPEELLAAAHAGCFSMALSMILGLEGLRADRIQTNCKITLDKVGEGFEITRSTLHLVARVPGATQEVFDRCAQTAKQNCPVSKLYKAEIILNAQLEKQ